MTKGVQALMAKMESDFSVAIRQVKNQNIFIYSIF